jgi:hypothetical protein
VGSALGRARRACRAAEKYTKAWVAGKTKAELIELLRTTSGAQDRASFLQSERRRGVTEAEAQRITNIVFPEPVEPGGSPDHT